MSLQRAVAAAVLGGTSSIITGGKFSNGAVTAAFSRVFNDEMAHDADVAQKEHDEALKGWAKANGKIISFKKNNPGETIPITEADLKAIAKYEALVLDKSMTDSYHSDAQGKADGYFFALDNKYNTFQITDGSLAGTYLGSDINYYYTGFVAAHHGVSRGYMNTLITLHNGAQAIGRWSARDWNQISTGKRFAGFGYGFYGAQK